MNKGKAVLSREMEDGVIILVNEMFSAEYLPVGIFLLETGGVIS
ncbi:MAG: hypothetical protein ACI4SF_14255 [Oscillospiraceae bacterium]